ncbi:MAG: HIT domain-containing protein [Bdellovibrionaceae bacterium]|jgi:ATP adenylyltransferase|nr:HIT domain-containing protein [Pseudobdellovibrionaceae bacterium]
MRKSKNPTRSSRNSKQNLKPPQKKKHLVTMKQRSDQAVKGGATGLSTQLTPLYRPQRARYIKGPKETDCVFCRVAKDKHNTLDNLCVYRTPLSMVVLNKFPYNTGHILVLPKKHKAYLNELSPAEYADLMEVVRLSERILREVYQPMGMNIGLNLGAAAGAGIPGHLHFHLIPRWSGDLNFFPLIAQSKVIIETPAETFHKLVKAFGSL